MFTKLSDEMGLVMWGELAGVAAGVIFVLTTIVNLIAPHQRGVFDPLATTCISFSSSQCSR
jgi:hypothetical protein